MDPLPPFSEILAGYQKEYGWSEAHVTYLATMKNQRMFQISAMNWMNLKGETTALPVRFYAMISEEAMLEARQGMPMLLEDVLEKLNQRFINAEIKH